MENLTKQQRLFCNEYLIDLNGTRAYKSAYPFVKKDATAAAAASRLLKNVNISNHINKKMESIEDKQIAKAEEVLQYLTSLMRGGEQEETLIGKGQGVQNIEDIDVSAKDRIRAAELIGRRYALFTDKVDVEGNIGAIIVDDIPDE